MIHYHLYYDLVFVWIHTSNVCKPAKEETPHSFKGQQLENKSLYRFVIYIGLWVQMLALIWHQICNKIPEAKLAEIHDDLSKNMRFQ